MNGSTVEKYPIIAQEEAIYDSKIATLETFPLASFVVDNWLSSDRDEFVITEFDCPVFFR